MVVYNLRTTWGWVFFFRGGAAGFLTFGGQGGGERNSCILYLEVPVNNSIQADNRTYMYKHLMTPKNKLKIT